MTKYPAPISGALLLLAACTTLSSGPTSGPPASLPTLSESPISADNLRKGSWILTPNSETQPYSSTLTTIIYQTDSPNIRRDSIITKTNFTTSQTRTNNGISWTGMITDFAIQPFLPDFNSKSSHFPLVFTGSSNNHQLQFDLDEQRGQEFSTSCNDLSKIPLSTVQRNSFVLPLQLSIGQTWQDSTSSTICAGSIPSTIIVIRTYHILAITEIQGVAALIITENERALSRGEGSLGQHRVTLESSATTTRQLNVESISGNLISSKATTKTLLAVQTSGRIQNFTQLTFETTTKSN